MFAVHEVTVEARYEMATARLIRLINWGALHGVSETAYEGGLQALVRVGPFGGTPGLSKLVRVRVLDADLILVREGDDRSRLRLIGSYRPPLGRAGAALDKAIMSRVAAATIRSLLDKVAAAIADPVPHPRTGTDTGRRWQPVTEPGGS